jgi:hypothetical protein
MMASSNEIDFVKKGFGFRFGGTDLSTGAEAMTLLSGWP